MPGLGGVKLQWEEGLLAGRAWELWHSGPLESCYVVNRSLSGGGGHRDIRK